MHPTIVDLGPGDDTSESEEETTEYPIEVTREESKSGDLENIDIAEFRARIRQCLDDVEHEGSFATFLHYESFPKSRHLCERLWYGRSSIVGSRCKSDRSTLQATTLWQRRRDSD